MRTLLKERIKKSKSMKGTSRVAVLMSILLLASAFLPFASAKDEYREALEKYESNIEQSVLGGEMDSMMHTVGLNVRDMKNISLYEYTKVYSEIGKISSKSEISYLMYLPLILFEFFALMLLFVSTGKKPIGMVVFDIATIGIFQAIQREYEELGIVPGTYYNRGFVSYMVYFLGVVILALSIWMFVEKGKIKKELKESESKFGIEEEKA